LEFLGMPALVASPAMHAVIELASRMARSSASVLILGESGSGKEVIARALHALSPRRNAPWVDISCGALPENLMESELFGHERGAFSGAEAAKPGLFELAHTGTLFLDEIGELEPRMQVKLLRVLDGAPYFRLGGTRKVAVDVRVLAATNSNLEESVRQGRFRADLYHRLNQLSLRVPPLRERIDDIEPLAELFLTRLDAALRFTPGALDLLRRQSWPGNVRELRNVVTRAAVFANDGQIDCDALGLPMTPVAVAAAVSRGEGCLEDLERETILRVLNETKGHRQRAAGLLGISRRTLCRKLKQYQPAAPESDAPDGNWSNGCLPHGKTA
jgi:transcriptional regulator with PAS, ATPase and Fis domain